MCVHNKNKCSKKWKKFAKFIQNSLSLLDRSQFLENFVWINEKVDPTYEYLKKIYELLTFIMRTAISQFLFHSLSQSLKKLSISSKQNDPFLQYLE